MPIQKTKLVMSQAQLAELFSPHNADPGENEIANADARERGDSARYRDGDIPPERHRILHHGSDLVADPGGATVVGDIGLPDQFAARLRVFGRIVPTRRGIVHRLGRQEGGIIGHNCPLRILSS